MSTESIALFPSRSASSLQSLHVTWEGTTDILPILHSVPTLTELNAKTPDTHPNIFEFQICNRLLRELVQESSQTGLLPHLRLLHLVALEFNPTLLAGLIASRSPMLQQANHYPMSHSNALK